MEKILCAAIHYTVYSGCFSKQAHPVKNNHKWPGAVICGWRHHNIISLWSHLMHIRTESTDTQGFLTSEGRFVDRMEAMDIALRAGQTRITEEDSGRPLYSEDLY